MITSLSPHPSFEINPKLAKSSNNFQGLLVAISQLTIPEPIAERINEITTGINNFSGPDPELLKVMKAGQAAILKLLEKELKIVPQNQYQTLWMVLGMSAFGVPLGVVFGTALGNIGLLGIGLPIGMAFGIAVGRSLDAKAKKEGRQLDWKAS